MGLSSIGSHAAQATANLGNHSIGSRSITGKCVLHALNDGQIVAPEVLTPKDCSVTGATIHIRAALAASNGIGMLRILVPNLAPTAVTGFKAGAQMVPIAGTYLYGDPGSNGGMTTSSPNDDGGSAPPAGPDSGQTSASGYQLFSWDALDSVYSTTLPAALSTTLEHPSWTASNWMRFPSIARTDGGLYPVVDIRLQYPAGGPGVSLSYDSFGDWGVDGRSGGPASNPFNGGQLWRTYAKDGLGLDGTINFYGQSGGESTTPWAQGKTVPIIIQYVSFGKVSTVLYLNDSIGEYCFSGVGGDVYAFRGALAAAQGAGLDMSWCTFATPSGAYSHYGYNAAAVLDAVQPSVICGKLDGPNEFNTGYTSMARGLGSLGHMLGMASRYGSRAIVETTLPSANAGIMALGANDANRVAGNARKAAICATAGAVFMDTASVLETRGQTNGGQREPSTTDVPDGIHLSDTGHAALTPVATAAFTSAFAG